MPPQRLRSTLYHSVPKPISRPAPLWQAAASLDPAAQRREETDSHAPPVAVPRGESSETYPPRTSAILAGWVCVGIGLLTAWIFPPAYLFFSIGVILSIVAMATHQIREGLLLLGGSAAGIGISALLFVCGLAALLFHGANKLSEIKPLPTPHLTAAQLPTPSPVVQHRPVALEGSVGPVPTTRPVPLTLGEVTAMISAGRSDDEITTAVFSRPPLGRLGAAETTTLRAYGASDRLIETLRAHFPPDNTPPSYQKTPAATPPPVARTPAPVQATRSAAPTPVLPTPVDYAARDREIAALNKQINTLDDSIRTFRNKYPKMTEYIAQMEKTREDLRRQKWAVEGR